MIGAIIGDIVGSRFEFNNYKSKDFELFTDDCFVTDELVGQALGYLDDALLKIMNEVFEEAEVKTSLSEGN